MKIRKLIELLEQAEKSYPDSVCKLQARTDPDTERPIAALCYGTDGVIFFDED